MVDLNRVRQGRMKLPSNLRLAGIPQGFSFVLPPNNGTNTIRIAE